MQEKIITQKGKQLFYRVAGEGTTVVLVHGFGEDGTVWDLQYDAFPGHKLIIPDLPGSGKSDPIEDMSMEGMAEALREMIVHEMAALYYKEGEPDSVVMIGHSMGGYITLAFAEKYSEMLKGFGLFPSTAYADSEEKKATRQKGIQFIREHGAFEFLKTTIPNLYSPETKEKSKEIILKHIASVHNFSPGTLVSYYEGMIRRPDRTHVLKQTHLPVLIMLGRHDTAVPIQDGLEQTHMPKLSYIHILEHSGHMGMREEPLEANQIISNYLRTIENNL